MQKFRRRKWSPLQQVCAIVCPLLCTVSVQQQVMRAGRKDAIQWEHYRAIMKQVRPHMGFDYKGHDIDSSDLASMLTRTDRSMRTIVTITKVTSPDDGREDFPRLRPGDIPLLPTERDLINRVLASRGRDLTVTVLRMGQKRTVTHPIPCFDVPYDPKGNFYLHPEKRSPFWPFFFTE